MAAVRTPGRIPSVFSLLSCICLAVVCCPSWVSAQVLYGTMLGNVRDGTNAAIAGAVVTAKNRDTNQTFEATTNAGGQYTLTNLQPGSYRVNIAVPGFKEYVAEDVEVTVNSITRLDVTMQVGSVNEVVTVSAKAGPIQTDKGDVHKQLLRQDITNLPMGGYHNYQRLIDLVPGSTPSSHQNAAIDTPARSLTTFINGTSRYGNTTRLDGALNIMPWLPTHSVYVAPHESIQSVSISTGSFDAEQGFAAGAAITVQTKSGTNKLHGVVFDYLRNSAFDARNFFTPQGSQAPKYILSMFGGNIGGPVIKDRLFFFANYDGLRDRQSFSSYYTVPTAEMRQGIFTDPRINTKIYDPQTGDQSNGKNRTPFTNNTIPATRISSVAQTMLSLLPMPNIAGTFVRNYYVSGPRQFDRDLYDFKVDWVRSPRNTIWFKYSLMDSLVQSVSALGEAGGPGLSDAGAGRGTVRVHVATVGGYYAITPRFLVDGTVGLTRYVHAARQADFGVNFGLDVLHIPGTNGPDPRQSGKPMFSISGYTGLGMVDTWMPADRHDYTYTYTANASWSRGKHDIRFGPDIGRFGMNHWQPEANGGPRGAFTFNGGATSLNAPGASTNRFNGFADFLLGLPQIVQKSLQFYDPMSTREWLIGLYFRDRWQVTSNLTLNLGIRWEYYPIVDRGFHGIERYDETTNKMLIGGYGGVDWNTGTTVSRKLFAPRFGVAYRMGRQGVLRAGYGIAYDPFNLGRPLRGIYPAVIQPNYKGPSTYIPYGPILNGIPPIPTPDITTGNVEIPGAIQTTSLPKGAFHRGYVQSWNLTYERALPLRFVWNVAYVGTRSINISSGTWWPINNTLTLGAGEAGRPLYQKFGRSASTYILQPWTNAHYHSLQTSLERRLTDGLMMRSVYTWSHSIDNNTAAVYGLAIGIPELFYLNRASSDFDLRHNFRTAAVYQLPWGPDRRWAKGGVAAAVIGGWQINSIFSAVTGRPFSVTANPVKLNTPGTTQYLDQVLPEIEKLGKIGSGQRFFDPAAFRPPVASGQLGTSGRNTLYGPGIVNIDVGIFRAFRIGEGKELQFRASSSNFTNTPHFINPSANASNPEFMSVLQASEDQRNFCFGLRFSF